MWKKPSLMVNFFDRVDKFRGVVISKHFIHHARPIHHHKSKIEVPDSVSDVTRNNNEFQPSNPRNLSHYPSSQTINVCGLEELFSVVPVCQLFLLWQEIVFGDTFVSRVQSKMAHWNRYLEKTMGIQMTQHGYPNFNTYIKTLCFLVLQTNEQTDGQMDKWTNGWTDGWMDRQADGQTDRQKDRQMEKRTDGWTDGRMD
jgi:hypothetical protein